MAKQICMPSVGSYQSSVNDQKGCCRTTIPQAVAKALAVSHKDLINWDIQTDEHGQIYVIVKKIS